MWIMQAPYKDGTTHVIFEPFDFIAKLVASEASTSLPERRAPPHTRLLVWLPETDLNKKGDPPALLGRHQQFDSNGSLIVTPKREPPSNTPRRNHETHREFKSYALGV